VREKRGGEKKHYPRTRTGSTEYVYALLYYYYILVYGTLKNNLKSSVCEQITAAAPSSIKEIRSVINIPFTGILNVIVYAFYFFIPNAIAGIIILYAHYSDASLEGGTYVSI